MKRSHVLAFAILFIAILSGGSQSVLANPNVTYDRSILGPNGRAGQASEQTTFGWTRIPSYRADGVTISEPANQNFQSAIGADATYLAWSRATGLNLKTFTYLQLREVDVAQAKTTVVYLTDKGLLQVTMPFAAGIRYTTANVLKQGTLFLTGQVVVHVGPNGPIDVQILAFNDSQETEALSRRFTPLLNSFDGQFASAIAAPVIRAQLANPVALSEWLSTSGAAQKITQAITTLKLR